MSTGIKVFMGGDMTGFQEMLVKARLSSRQFAREVGNDVGKSWGEAFSMKSLVGGAAGFFGFEALKGHLEGIISKAENLKDLSEQFDMSTDSIQRWTKATANAGLTFNTFLRGMETLRAKREDALSDPKKMGAFEALGISEQELRGTTDMDKLLLRVLNSGKSRGAMADVLGPRGVRLKGAADYYASHLGGSVSMSEDDIADIDRASKDMEEAKGMFGKWSMRGGPGRAMASLSKLLRGDFKGAAIGWMDVMGSGFTNFTGDIARVKRQSEADTTDDEPKMSRAFTKEELDAQIRDQERLEKARDKWAKEQMPVAMKAGNLADIGIMTGGAANFPMMRVAERQLEALLRIEANTKSMKDLESDY